MTDGLLQAEVEITGTKSWDVAHFAAGEPCGKSMTVGTWEAKQLHTAEQT